MPRSEARYRIEVFGLNGEYAYVLAKANSEGIMTKYTTVDFHRLRSSFSKPSGEYPPAKQATFQQESSHERNVEVTCQCQPREAHDFIIKMMKEAFGTDVEVVIEEIPFWHVFDGELENPYGEKLIVKPMGQPTNPTEEQLSNPDPYLDYDTDQGPKSQAEIKEFLVGDKDLLHLVHEEFNDLFVNQEFFLGDYEKRLAKKGIQSITLRYWFEPLLRGGHFEYLGGDKYRLSRR